MLAKLDDRCAEQLLALKDNIAHVLLFPALKGLMNFLPNLLSFKKMRRGIRLNWCYVG